MRIAYGSIWVYGFITLSPPHGSLRHLTQEVITTLPPPQAVPTPPLHGSFRRLIQGRQWFAPLNKVRADFNRLPCVRGAGTVR